MTAVRTRFAPSPSGHLHLGGARTALFNFLYAQRFGGSFILRIEDSDRERSRDEFVEAIVEGLAWLGISYDEGPFFQSKRGDIYASRVQELLEAGRAYHCFCSAEELEVKRKAAQAEGRRASYDGSCRELGRTPRCGENSVIRFRAQRHGVTRFEDLVRGSVAFENSELDDLILVRSDGTPTFHLVVVVDDIDMGITHILRGEDHLTNTPKQIQICEAFATTPPRYGHLPLIVGADRARLSKRHGATALEAYREQGFLPQAVVNYLVRLGWSHGDQEIFSTEELCQLFDVGGVGKAAAAFDMEKFTWVNGQHMKALSDDELAVAVAPFLTARGATEQPRELVAGAAGLLKERAKTLVELAEMAHCFVSDDIVYQAKAAAKFLSAANIEVLTALAESLEATATWDSDAIAAAFAAVMERFDLKLGKLAQPARVALTGTSVSPGIYEVCELLGRKRTVDRLRRTCEQAADGSLPLVGS